MYNPIQEKRNEICNNIAKSFGNGNEPEDIEKAKWQIGEVRVDSRGIAHECFEYTADGKPHLRRVKKQKGAPTDNKTTQSKTSVDISKISDIEFNGITKILGRKNPDDSDAFRYLESEKMNDKELANFIVCAKHFKNDTKNVNERTRKWCAKWEKLGEEELNNRKNAKDKAAKTLNNSKSATQSKTSTKSEKDILQEKYANETVKQNFKKYLGVDEIHKIEAYKRKLPKYNYEKRSFGEEVEYIQLSIEYSGRYVDGWFGGKVSHKTTYNYGLTLDGKLIEILERSIGKGLNFKRAVLINNSWDMLKNKDASTTSTDDSKKVDKGDSDTKKKESKKKFDFNEALKKAKKIEVNPDRLSILGKSGLMSQMFRIFGLDNKVEVRKSGYGPYEMKFYVDDKKEQAYTIYSRDGRIGAANFADCVCDCIIEELKKKKVKFDEKKINPWIFDLEHN